MYFEQLLYSRVLAHGISGRHIDRVEEMQKEISNYDEVHGDSTDIDAVMSNIHNIIENYDLLNNMREFYIVQVYKLNSILNHYLNNRNKFRNLYSNYTGRKPDNIVDYYNKIKSYGFRENSIERLGNQFVELKENTNRIEV